MYLLLVEDNQDLAANIGEFLESRGVIVDYAADGLSGLHLASTNNYDLVVTDLSLPGIDGITLCRRLRNDANQRTPVLMLTARDTEQDKLEGFDAGTDDYLTKPFSLHELLARVQALYRRSKPDTRVLSVADLEFDQHTLIVRRGERRIVLTPAALRLLRILMITSPGVVSREQAERAVWGDDPPTSDAALRGHVHALRQAVDKESSTSLLHTIHGMGYRLAVEDE